MLTPTTPIKTSGLGQVKKDPWAKTNTENLNIKPVNKTAPTHQTFLRIEN